MVADNSFISFESDVLSRMIEQTSYAICHDETKYNLNGIYFKLLDSEDGRVLKLVATDGHRLCIAEQVLDGGGNEMLEKGLIFPKKGITELKKLCDEESTVINIGFIDNNAVLLKGNSVIVMRLVDGEFPDYTRVVPTGNNREIVVNRDFFLHSLKRISILSSEKFKGIKFDIQNGVMELSSSNPELGEAREELEVVYDGERITTRFNARYLIDVLNVLSEEHVVLQLKDEMSPAILRPAARDNFLSVIMPMRL
jgi:DNA polymerase-3 subunit beta